MKDIKITVPDRDASPEDVITVYVVWPHGFASFCTRNVSDIIEFLEICADGERVTVRIETISEAVFNAMPEYQGP